MPMNKVIKRALLGGAVAAGLATWAAAPRSFGDKRRHFVPSIPDVWYAHRGLHDAGSGLTEQYAGESGEYVALARRLALKSGYATADVVTPIAPENSLPAFASACEAGFGIELDIQLSKDGQVVVVHDGDLLRVAGDPRRIRDLTYDELTRIPLFGAPSKPGQSRAHELSAEELASRADSETAPSGYYQHVPLLSDVLRVVAGRAPLIVEYKFNDFTWNDADKELMERGDALLRSYDGPYVVESFHPGALYWYKEHRPEVCRGQLSENVPFENADFREWVAGKLVFDWLSRPDFIAYGWPGGNSPQVRLCRMLGAVPVSWTIRSRDELEQADPWFDRHIFESFVPHD